MKNEMNKAQKSIQDYRQGIQMLKHKLNKLGEVNSQLQEHLQLNDFSQSLYVRPIAISNVKSRSIQYYCDELLKIVRYRGLTIESLFRMADINNDLIIELDAFKKFLYQFLDYSELKDSEKIRQTQIETDKLISHIISIFDINYGGTIEKNDFYQLVQVFKLESEDHQFQIKQITLNGQIIQNYQNIYHYTLQQLINKKLDIKQTIKKIQQKQLKLDEFINFCSDTLNLNQILSRALFNYIDRYNENTININIFEFHLTQIFEANFNLQLSTKQLNLILNQNMLNQCLIMRSIIESINTTPIKLFLECDCKGKGKLQTGEFLKFLEKSFKKSKKEFEPNLALNFLRHLDYRRSGFIDSGQFVYALMNTQDIAELCSDISLRSRILNTNEITNDLEVLSLLAHKMNSMGMKPSDWYRALTKGKQSDSISVHIVRDSLMQIGIRLADAIDIVRIIDRNLNFFIEYSEIVQIFGQSIKLQEDDNQELQIRQFVKSICEQFGSIDKGVAKIFEKFDRDRSGAISRDEFLYALDQVDDKISLTEDQKLIILEKADKNRDNSITLKEFKEFMIQNCDYVPREKEKSGKQVRIISNQSSQTQLSSMKGIKQVKKEVMVFDGHPQAEIINKIRISQIDVQSFNYYQIIEQLQECENPLYFDNGFLPQKNRISIDPQSPLLKLNIEFKRPFEYIDEQVDIKLFSKSMNPCNINQGILANSYLLSALSALAEKPHLIKRIFDGIEYNHYGIYCIWFCLNGAWQYIIIDDLIPCQFDIDQKWNTVFSRSGEDELWLVLLEKAYAKAYGSYSNIEYGLTGQALRDLTGSPYEIFKLKNTSQNLLWEFLERNKNFIVTASSQLQELNQNNNNSLSLHAYLILDHQLLRFQGKEYRMIKLRNPWNHWHWRGRWSKGSEQWTQETQYLLKYEKQDESITWMQIEDFLIEFLQVCANKIHENYIYSSQKINVQNNDKPYIWRGKLKFQTTDKDVHGYITISQMDSRYFRNQKIQEYSYQCIRFVVYQDIQGFQIISHAFGSQRDLSVDIQLKNNQEYNIHIEIDMIQPDSIKQFILSAYTQSETLFLEPVTCEQLETQKIVNTLIGGSISKNNINYPENKLISKEQGEIAGYLFFNYKNDSESSTLYETLKLFNVANLTEISMDQIKKIYDVEVQPNSAKSIIFRINGSQNCEYSIQSQCQYKIINSYNDKQLIAMAQSKPQRSQNRIGPRGPIDVLVNDLVYDEGFAILITNNMKLKYKEILKLELQNLQTQQNQSEFMISLESQESYLIKLKIISPDKPVSYQSKYTIIK